MNLKILKLMMVLPVLIFYSAGCQKDELEYADDSIVVSNRPGISIYKTKGDYSNYIFVGVDTTGNITRLPDYTYGSGSVGIKNEHIVYSKNRYFLKSGYIVEDISTNSVFTDITMKEYVDYNQKNGVAVWPDSLIYPRIIDHDPFTEFYFMGCLICHEKKFTLGEINEMLENGTIEQHFTKFK